MAQLLKIDFSDYKIHIQKQKAALEASSRFKKKEKIRLTEIFDELILVYEARIASELQVVNAQQL